MPPFFFLPRRCSLCRPQCPNQKMGKVGKTSTPQAAGPSHGSLSTLSAWMLALTTEKAAVKQRENLLRKINPQMSRERQVILYSCQEITQPLPITPVICGMPINSHQGLQWPHHSHWCKQAGSVSSQQVRELQGLEEHVASQRRLSLGAGAASAPCAANNRGWLGAPPAIWKPALRILHPNAFLTKGGTLLEGALLRQQQPRSTKGKM